MAWLSKKTMQKKASQLTDVPHPLLSQVELSLGDKMIYLQGCVLAALLDDENVSEDESKIINRIGLSLGLSVDEISECLFSVGGLKSEEDKEAFLDELKGGVSDFPISKFFMADFEEVMKKKGKVPKSSVEFLDFVGGQIVGGKWAENVKRRNNDQFIKRKQLLEEEIAGIRKKYGKWFGRMNFGCVALIVVSVCMWLRWWELLLYGWVIIAIAMTMINALFRRMEEKMISRYEAIRRLAMESEDV